MTWKPAMLHESKVYQEFQRLASYLNGTGAGAGASGTLSVVGSARYTGSTDSSVAVADNFTPAWTLAQAEGVHGITLQASDTQAQLPAGVYQAYATAQFNNAVAGTDVITDGGLYWEVNSLDTPGIRAVNDMGEAKNLSASSADDTTISLLTPIFNVTSVDQYLQLGVFGNGVGNYLVSAPRLYIVRLG